MSNQARSAELDKDHGTTLGSISITRRLFSLLAKIQVRPMFILLSVSLSFITAIFAAMEIALLIPLLRGIIQGDFGFIQELPVFDRILLLFPNYFSSHNMLFLLVVIALFTVAVFHNVLAYLSNLCVQYQTSTANGKIRALVFNRYLGFGKLFFDRSGIGDLNTILMTYSSSISSQLSIIHKLLGDLFGLTAYIIMILMISWKLTLLTVIVFPSMNYLSHLIIVQIRKIAHTHFKARKMLDKKIFNILTCIPLVKANAMEEEEKRHFKNVSQSEVYQAFLISRMAQLVKPVQNLCTLVAFLFIAFALNQVVSQTGAYEASSFIVFFYIVRRMVPGFNAVNKFNLSLARASAGIRPVLEMLEDDTDKHIIPAGSKVFRGLKQGIEFRNLNFSYYPETQVLRNLSFKIRQGTTTAIVGSTGSGKTSIISLILRFYDCPANSILVDGTDIRDYTLESLRSRMALVSQDAFLFNDTLKANLLYGTNGNLGPDALSIAVKKARLDSFIKSLPGGCETIVGERGIQLSGGEKQRVSIARALLKDTDLLILDEATSSLDSTTESLIQDGINEAIRGKTAIVIAHRLSTIKHADKILVIEKGSLVEEGTLDSLLEKNGLFQEYWSAQKFQ